MKILQRDMSTLQQGMNGAQDRSAVLDAKLEQVQSVGNTISKVQATLASPIPLGRTASVLLGGSYYNRALFFLDLYNPNFDFLLSVWTRWDRAGSYLDIDGIRMAADFPDNVVGGHRCIFRRSFYIYLFFGDNYERDVVLAVEKVIEYVRQYVDETIDVRVMPGDTVIDAGAWIGDFSAYTAHKGAVAHAFEPTPGTYDLLLRTAALNEGRIIPVMKGLGAANGTMTFGIGSNAAANKILRPGEPFVEDESQQKASIEIVTLDAYVEEKNLQRVDFIKADVEGGEEDLLAGATKTLRKFAPKLSIATDHISNNIEEIKKIVLHANPTYKFVVFKRELLGAGSPIEA